MCFRVFAWICLIACMPAGPVVAQEFQTLHVEPSLDLRDINNDLLGVGKQRSFGPAPPFILSTEGVRFFQEFRQLSPQFVSSTGAVVGHGTLSGQGGIFRARIDGSGYSELSYSFPLVVSIAQLTDVGVALFHVHGTSPGGRRFYTGTFLWDGSSQISVFDSYGLPGTAVPVSLGEDGLIGGAWNNQPFLKSADGHLMQPWSGGSVQKIGPGGHVVGHDEARRLIVRRPDGSLETYPELADQVIVSDINRAGDVVGTFIHPTRMRTEGFLVRNDQVIYLSEYFDGAVDDVLRPNAITDSGVILASVWRGFDVTRQIVLAPRPAAPSGLAATVSARQVSLSWQPVVGASEYVLAAGSSPGASDLVNSAVGPATSIGGTVPPGTYWVRVLARGVLGIGPSSNEIVVEVR